MALCPRGKSKPVKTMKQVNSTKTQQFVLSQGQNAFGLVKPAELAGSWRFLAGPGIGHLV